MSLSQGSVADRPCYYQTAPTWSIHASRIDRGSSAAYTFAATVITFCDMQEGLSQNFITEEAKLYTYVWINLFSQFDLCISNTCVLILCTPSLNNTCFPSSFWLDEGQCLFIFHSLGKGLNKSVLMVCFNLYVGKHSALVQGFFFFFRHLPGECCDGDTSFEPSMNTVHSVLNFGLIWITWTSLFTVWGPLNLITPSLFA